MGPKKVSDKGQPKKIVVRMTIEQKQEIIRKHEDGMRVNDLARLYKKSSSTISTLIAKKRDIMSANVAKGVSVITKKRTQELEEVEKLLLIFINERQAAGDSVNEAMIRAKALNLYDDLLKKNPGTSDGAKIDFVASRGWFENFKRRSGIHSVVRHGEAASSDKTAAEEFVVKFKQLVESGEYLPQQVFNCDETGLFWKKMPKRTYITQEEKALPGHKPMKDRLTLLLCGNASGDLKMKPMLVYHSQNPRIFKKHNVQTSTLNVLWRANSKAWVTRQFFLDWIKEVFCPSVKKYLEENSLPLKALLVLDNATAHPHGLEDCFSDEFNFIKIEFLPPNTTPLIQPMDQQIISNFKKLYTKALFQRCLDVTSQSLFTLRDFWKNHFHILSCVRLIEKAWAGVTQRTMNAGWRNLWPDCVPERDFEGFGPEPVIEEIVSLGQTLGLEVDAGDVEELVEEHRDELTTEELQVLYKEQRVDFAEAQSEEEDIIQDVSASELRETCVAWEKMQSLMERIHPDKALAINSNNAYNDTMICYLRKLLKRKQKQSTLDKYVVKKPTSDTQAGPSGEPKPGPSGVSTKRRRVNPPEESSVPKDDMEEDSPPK